MIETFTIITLSVLFLIFFRPGKTPPLNNLLVIERPGQYHITLMPLLNLAQPFVESIAQQIGASNEVIRYSKMQCFEVRDNQVVAHGYKSYLLAITRRNGMLYFHAASPQSDDPNSHFPTIKKFADENLSPFPAIGTYDATLDTLIVTATQEAARLRSIEIKHLAFE
jgi:hypothetical protein